MQGIIERARENPLPENDASGGAAANTTTGYQAENIELDEQKDTVAGRVSSIIDKNSALQQAARTQGLQTANQRGILNSSLAVEAAEKAVIDSALPIAQQDAATSYDARRSNQDANNRALEFLATGAQQQEQQAQQGIISSRLQQEQGEIQSGLQQQQGDIDSRLIAERGEIDKALQTADLETRERLLERQGEIDAELERVRGGVASELQAQAFNEQSQLQAEQGRIQEALIGAEGEQREQLLQAQGEVDARLEQLRGGIQADLQAQRGQIDLQLQTADFANRQELLKQQAQIDMDLARVNGDIQSELQAERGLIDLELQDADFANREQLLERQGEIDASLQNLRNEGAIELADVEGQWRNLLQASQSATAYYSEYATQIGSILNNPELKPYAKDALVTQLKRQVSDGLELIGGIANLDLTGLIGGNDQGEDQESTLDLINRFRS